MLAATDLFKAAIRQSHSRDLRVHLYGDSYTAPDIDYGELFITRGTMDSDINNIVGRTLRADIAIGPYDPLEPRAEQFLAVENGYLTVEVGVRFPTDPGAPEWVQVATLRLTRFRPRATLATINIEAMDRTVMLMECPVLRVEFDEEGYQAKLTAGWDWRTCISDLVKFAMKDESVTYDAGLTAGNIDPKTNLLGADRAATIDQLAAAHNAWLRCDANGQLHLSPRPTVAVSPVWEIQHGAEGVLVENREDYAREDIYNAVLVEWQEPENNPPDNYRQGFDKDDDPTSPTYWDGPFGRRIKVINDIPVHSDAEAFAKAAQHLSEHLGRYFAIEVTALANPLLELGDTIEVAAMDLDPHLRVIERISLPLGPDATMTIGTRTALT